MPLETVGNHWWQLATMTSMTGRESATDWPITRNTAAVAVCCSCALGVVEQACVVERDGGLGGKGFEQFDLGCGEQAGRSTVYAHRAERAAIAQDRHCQGAARAAPPDDATDVGGYASLLQDIGNMDGAAFAHDTGAGRISVDLHGVKCRDGSASGLNIAVRGGDLHRHQV